MLFAMEPELQNRFEEYPGPFEILEELKTMFQTQARSEGYEISEKFFNCKMEEGSSVSEHAIKMTGYTNALSNWNARFQRSSIMTWFCNHSHLATKVLY